MQFRSFNIYMDLKLMTSSIHLLYQTCGVDDFENFNLIRP